MKDLRSDFDSYLKKEIDKYGGIMVPVRASVPERLLMKKTSPRKLHPNPDDEFSWPSIGPSKRIISEYITKYQRFGSMSGMNEISEEPIMVQKVHPDGYMILNGHHRWAAYWKLGVRSVPISIVNLTQETDIERMIRDSGHDKRVTLDLDEVVFCLTDEDPAEKPLRFPLNRIYKEKIRLGIPALLHVLSRQGYDIWIYTAGYYSYDYIQAYFKSYNVKVDGIITGTARKEKSDPDTKKKMAQLISRQYKETLHIDRNSILRTYTDSKEFEEYEIKEAGRGWSAAAIAVIKGLNKGK